MDTDLLLNDFAIRCFRDEEIGLHFGPNGISSRNNHFTLGASNAGEVCKMHSSPEPHSGHESHARPAEGPRSHQCFQQNATPPYTKYAKVFRLHRSVRAYRYLEKSRFVDTSNIVNLDRAAWELRRYCALDPAPRQLSLVQGVTTPKFELAGGYLESIIDDHNNPAREPLLWRNFFFGRRQRRFWKKPSFRFRASKAPLQMHPEILGRGPEVYLFAKAPDPGIPRVCQVDMNWCFRPKAFFRTNNRQCGSFGLH